MRITFLVNHDIASLLALNYLLPSLNEHDFRVFFTFKKMTKPNEALAELGLFDAQQLEERSSLLSFDELGAQRLNHINNADYRRFADTSPDLVISIRHMSILKSEVINTPLNGVINLHSGVLPNYQGVMASFWALLHEQSQLGTSLHLIEDSKIDAGSIISQSLTAANYERSYWWNVLNIYRSGCDNIVDAINQLQSRKSLSSKPQSGQANYYSFPTLQEINRCSVPLFSPKDDLEHFL